MDFSRTKSPVNIDIKQFLILEKERRREEAEEQYEQWLQRKNE